MDGESVKKWKAIYPVYLNSKKTIAEGRTIGRIKACENPTAAEIGHCCAHLKIPFAVELDKLYPRDFTQRGRVRVSLTNGDGSPHNPAISSRKQLMERIAELVPRHPGRTKKPDATSASTSSAVAALKANCNRKGGKKRR